MTEKMFIFHLLFFLSVQLACKDNQAQPSVAEHPKDSIAEPLVEVVPVGPDDPFPAFLGSIPSSIVEISTSSPQGKGFPISVKCFTFGSRGNTNTVYARIAQPQEPGIYPAILFLHGGGSNAEAMNSLLEQFAGEGYVTMSIDIPGIAGVGNTPYSDGPWKSRPIGEGPRLEVREGVGESTLVDAIVAGIEAFNLLSDQPNVDNQNIGISGTSWGGYTTTMLSGILGNRVQAAYAIFGCGFYDKGSFWMERINQLSGKAKETWLKYLDAGRRAPTITAPYFIEAPTNDTYFWPEAVMATLGAITAEKNQLFLPNLNHKASAYSTAYRKKYFDLYLKREGKHFPKVTIEKSEMQDDNSKKIFISVKLPEDIEVEYVKLYYSEPAANRTLREWRAIDASLASSNSYTAIIPEEFVKKGVNYFAVVMDSRTLMSSSLIY